MDVQGNCWLGDRFGGLDQVWVQNCQKLVWGSDTQVEAGVDARTEVDSFEGPSSLGQALEAGRIGAAIGNVILLLICPTFPRPNWKLLGM